MKKAQVKKIAFIGVVAIGSIIVYRKVQAKVPQLPQV